MTCRRRGRGYVCKDVSAMDTLGRGRGLPRLVAPKSAMSSPQSPPCPAPAKDQSRATLPWVSFPRKGCPFAGSPSLARNDMQKTDTRVRLQGRHTLRRPKASGGATLPWGSSPRKGCPFAGSPSLARNDMLKFARCPRSTGVLPEGDLVRGSERNHWHISMSALGNQAGGAKFWQGAQWRRRNFVAIARSLFFVSS